MTTDQQFSAGKRRGKAEELVRSEAYKAVFTMKQATPEALEMVMNDLAEFSGYFAVLPTGASHAEFAEFNGRRAVFARIKSLIGINGNELERLRAAALLEMQISNEEGER